MNNESISYFQGTAYDAHHVLTTYENAIKNYEERIVDANINKNKELEQSLYESLKKVKNKMNLLKEKLEHYYFELDFEDYNDPIYEIAYFISYVAYYNGEMIHDKDIFNTIVYFDSRDNITGENIKDLEASLLKNLQKESIKYDVVQILGFNKLN